MKNCIPTPIIPYVCFMKERGIGTQIKEYLYIKKKDKGAPNNMNVRLMHGMNRISIIMFLIAIVIIIVRLLTKR